MLTDLPANYSWFLKYKLHHLPFWLLYHYAWWSLTMGSAFAAFHDLLFSSFSIKFLFYVIFQAVGVYFNLYFLIPRFLAKGNYLLYVAYLLLTIVFTAAFIVTGYYITAWVDGRAFEEIWHKRPDQFFHFFNVNSLPSTVASMTLAMSVMLTKNWINAQRRQQILETEKLETELKFLKSQFNPHFLFNTINSIFVLIHKNPEMASESLAKFSDLLRYQLYECNEPRIPLGQELGYLENFIALEKLRQDDTQLALFLNINTLYTRDLAIAPFILMPFMENAFKHVSRQSNHDNWIKMNLYIKDSALFLELANSTDALSANPVVKSSGIGLSNVKRRLNLVYPGKHTLAIKQDTSNFTITLQLDLDATSATENLSANDVYSGTLSQSYL